MSEIHASLAKFSKQKEKLRNTVEEKPIECVTRDTASRLAIAIQINKDTHCRSKQVGSYLLRKLVQAHSQLIFSCSFERAEMHSIIVQMKLFRIERVIRAMQKCYSLSHYQLAKLNCEKRSILRRTTIFSNLNGLFPFEVSNLEKLN